VPKNYIVFIQRVGNRLGDSNLTPVRRFYCECWHFLASSRRGCPPRTPVNGSCCAVGRADPHSSRPE